jgi:drug/metabolite transporter (DMT)-like permease
MASFWIIAVAVILNTVNKLYTKFAIHKTDSFTFLLAINVLAGILSFPILLINFNQAVVLTWWQIFIMFCVGGLWSLNGYLAHLTIEKSEVSVREPLTQLQIVWATLSGIFFFKEVITTQQFFGIILILISGMVLVYKKGVTQNFSKEKHLFLILVYTLFTAFVAAMEKFVMSFTTPEVFMFFSYFSTSILLIPFISTNLQNVRQSIKYKGVLFWGGLLTFITYIATLYVYKNFDFAISYPLLKIATPLTAVAGILLFNEKKNLGRKIVAIVLATLGVVLIKVSL